MKTKNAATKAKPPQAIPEPPSLSLGLPASTTTLLDAHGGMWAGTWRVEVDRATHLVLRDDMVKITDGRTGRVILRMHRMKTP